MAFIERRHNQQYHIDTNLRQGFKLDSVVVLPNNGEVICNGQRRHLAPKALEILLYLCQNKNQIQVKK